MLLLGMSEKKAMTFPTAPAVTANLVGWWAPWAGVNGGAPADGDPAE